MSRVMKLWILISRIYKNIYMNSIAQKYSLCELISLKIILYFIVV